MSNNNFSIRCNNKHLRINYVSLKGQPIAVENEYSVGKKVEFQPIRRIDSTPGVDRTVFTEEDKVEKQGYIYSCIIRGSWWRRVIRKIIRADDGDAIGSLLGSIQGRIWANALNPDKKLYPLVFCNKKEHKRLCRLFKSSSHYKYVEPYRFAYEKMLDLHRKAVYIEKLRLHKNVDGHCTDASNINSAADDYVKKVMFSKEDGQYPFTAYKAYQFLKEALESPFIPLVRNLTEQDKMYLESHHSCKGSGTITNSQTRFAPEKDIREVAKRLVEADFGKSGCRDVRAKGCETEGSTPNGASLMDRMIDEFILQGVDVVGSGYRGNGYFYPQKRVFEDQDFSNDQDFSYNPWSSIRLIKDESGNSIKVKAESVRRKVTFASLKTDYYDTGRVALLHT